MTQVMVREWLLILSILLGAVGIVAGGYAYHLEQVEDEAEEATVSKMLEMVDHNQQLLMELKTQPAARPLAFDACAGAALAEAMRQKGVKIPPQEFEQRCQQARK